MPWYQYGPLVYGANGLVVPQALLPLPATRLPMDWIPGLRVGVHSKR